MATTKDEYLYCIRRNTISTSPYKAMANLEESGRPVTLYVYDLSQGEYGVLLMGAEYWLLTFLGGGKGSQDRYEPYPEFLWAPSSVLLHLSFHELYVYPIPL